jgi:hypothetical protein
MLIIPDNIKDNHQFDPGIFSKDYDFVNYISNRSFIDAPINAIENLKSVNEWVRFPITSPYFECYHVAREYFIKQLVKSDEPYFVCVTETQALVPKRLLFSKFFYKSKLENIITENGIHCIPKFPLVMINVYKPRVIRKSDHILDYNEWEELCQLKTMKTPN